MAKAKKGSKQKAEGKLDLAELVAKRGKKSRRKSARSSAGTIQAPEEYVPEEAAETVPQDALAEEPAATSADAESTETEVEACADTDVAPAQDDDTEVAEDDSQTADAEAAEAESQTAEADAAQSELADPEAAPDSDTADPDASADAQEADAPQDQGEDEEQDLDGLKAIVEAILFVAPEPMATGKISRAIGGTSGAQVRAACQSLAQDYDETGRSFQLLEVAGGWQMLTRPDYEPYLRRFKKDRDNARLSPAAIETLAIIAYRQPIQRAEIENLRGVGCGAILKTLMDKRLVKIVGRSEELGRPVLYGTTNEFLSHFGLKGLNDLPRSLEFKG